jgi:hypothetical protein
VLLVVIMSNYTLLIGIGRLAIMLNGVQLNVIRLNSMQLKVVLLNVILMTYYHSIDGQSHFGLFALKSLFCHSA